MSVPAVAVPGALFVIARSASRCAVVVAVAGLLVALVFPYATLFRSVAVFVIGPIAAGLMCTTIVKVWLAPGASAPKVQVTVRAKFVQPAAETKLTCAGSTSVTVPPLEVDGPLLVTVRV